MRWEGAVEGVGNGDGGQAVGGEWGEWGEFLVANGGEWGTILG